MVKFLKVCSFVDAASDLERLEFGALLDGGSGRWDAATCLDALRPP
jgi:hypothetical protein